MKKNFLLLIITIIIVLAIIIATVLLKNNKQESNIKNETITSGDVIKINSETIQNEVKLTKSAADNIANKIQKNNISGLIKVKSYEIEKHEDSQINNNVYTIVITDENNKEYTIVVNGEGWFGTIRDENGKYIYYEID